MSPSTSGALLGSSSGSAVVELPGPARSAPRLELLLNLVASSSSDPAQTDDILFIISQSGLLSNVPQDETQHKLTVRITALISSQNALGYQLANLWIQQDRAVWNDHLISNAAAWATQIVNILSAPDKLLLQREHSDRLLAAALQFAVTHLFPENVASRQEFYRQVVHPNLPKFVVGLTQLLESIFAKQNAEGYAVFASHLHTVLVFIDRLLHAHPAQCRPVSPRMLECVSAMLYRDDALSIPLPVFNASAAVLSSLHLTGALASKGSEASGGSSRTTQSQLWQATIETQVHLAAEAWRHATSSFQITDMSQLVNDGQSATLNKHLSPYAKDPLAATKQAHRRITLLLGSRGRSGLINSHLRAATSRPVPVPVGELITLALDMLRIDLTSRFKATAEAKVCSLQSAHLPTLHTRALALITQLAITVPAAMSLEGSRVLGDICRIAEIGVSAGTTRLVSTRVKLATMRTLAVLVGRHGVALPLDPAGRVTLRLARLAVTQIARAVLQPVQTTSSTTSGDDRKAKKVRLYESDSMFGSDRSPKDRIHDVSVEDIASTQAALQVLVAVYPHLTTTLSAMHYDQVQLSIQTVLALVECLADSTSTHSATLRSQSAGSYAPTTAELLQEAMEALAELCLDSCSSTLALVLPRAIPVLGRIAHAPSSAGNAKIRSVAGRALMAVHASRKGKFVPVAKGVGFGPRATDDLEAAPEGAKLSGASGVGRSIPTTSEALGSSIISATTAVLGAMGESHLERDEDSVEAGVNTEARMDVDAITAESAELLKASGPDAACSAPPTGLALGLPTSPRRSPIARRIFSPDPVKPNYRPSTPRIGSPSTPHPPCLSRTASPSLDAGAFISHGRLANPVCSPTTTFAVPATTDAPVQAAVQVVNTSAVAEAAQEIISNTKTAATAMPATRGTHMAELEETRFMDGSDDDEDMPEIDVGDSDDDEEAEA